jgi:hypothetical protein
MNPIALLGVGLVLAVGLGLWWWVRRGDEAAAEQASSRPQRSESLDTVAGWVPEPTRLLTQAERRALALLSQALPKHTILAQVPLARFIRVPTRNSYTEWMRRVGQVCADLLVCDAASQVVAVVELRRPPGQDSERTRKRHARMDRVLQKAGIRVVVWNEEALPHVEAVRDQILPTARMAVPSAPAGPRTATVTAVTAAPAAPVMAAMDFTDTEPEPDEIIELRDPPASTWFDNLDSALAPLDAPRH